MRRWLVTLARVSVLPRTEMRRILDAGPAGTLFPLVLLASASGFFKDFNAPAVAERLPVETWLLPVIVVLFVLVMALVGAGLLWLLAWGATWIGRLLDGTGERGQVHLALAWGLAPVIWALLYRLPLSLMGVGNRTNLEIGGSRFRFDPGLFSRGCGVALLFALVDLAILGWYLTVASRTLAEAHRFSAWRGLGTLLICFAAPFVAVLAFFLSRIT